MLWDRAVRQFYKNDFARSRDSAERLLKEDHKNLLARTLTALIDMIEGRFEEAFEGFTCIFSETSTSLTEDGRYLHLFSEIYVHRMSEVDADVSEMIQEAFRTRCNPALKRWFPL
jgi:hypothetical protein